ncbi:hypothetical protein TNCV_3543181 [Trichonephila clavipes]|nr:hypothetical protein TNCV_3543181 [Trichonephila clavipes]
MPADGASNRNRDPKPNVGVEKRVKRDKSHTKRALGTFLGDVKGRVWIKGGGQESCKTVKKKRGEQKTGSIWKGEGFKGDGFRFKGDSVHAECQGKCVVSKERIFKSREKFQRASVHDEFQMRGFQMRGCS